MASDDNDSFEEITIRDDNYNNLIREDDDNDDNHNSRKINNVKNKSNQNEKEENNNLIKESIKVCNPKLFFIYLVWIIFVSIFILFIILYYDSIMINLFYKRMNCKVTNILIEYKDIYSYNPYNITLERAILSVCYYEKNKTINEQVLNPALPLVNCSICFNNIYGNFIKQNIMKQLVQYNINVGGEYECYVKMNTNYNASKQIIMNADEYINDYSASIYLYFTIPFHCDNIDRLFIIIIFTSIFCFIVFTPLIALIYLCKCKLNSITILLNNKVKNMDAEFSENEMLFEYLNEQEEEEKEKKKKLNETNIIIIPGFDENKNLFDKVPCIVKSEY